MAEVGFFKRLGNLWRGFLSIWISDVEKEHPEIAYENAINSMVEKYSKLKSATAAIIRRREDTSDRFKRVTRELAQTEAELGVAMDTDQDDVALILLQKKNQLTADIGDLNAEMDGAQKDADSAKASLMSVQGEIRKLQAERDSMLAKMQSAQARLKIQGQLDGLSVDAEVKALENVREHIKNTIAEANLGKELSESSLDAKLAAVRSQVGEVQAKQQLAELKAKRAAAQAAQGEDDVEPYETHALRQAVHHRGRHRRARVCLLALPRRGTPPVGGRRQAGHADGGDAWRERLRRAEERAAGPGRGESARRASRPPASASGGKLSRTLVVGINTWAGHAPGRRVQRRPGCRTPRRTTGRSTAST